ncbi:MAG: class I tRNA ligase family protein, partial [Spirochaetales bacterium]|nr:class I tRNA ligase family protein [Spirochaetales bacterium]
KNNNDNAGSHYKKHQQPRPAFPDRVIITAGMPYGNKNLHFGHIAGVFVPADVFARFMRDRIGKENVIFISGTDCYGSPIVEYYNQLIKKGEFEGSISEFVSMNHENQKKALAAYNIDLNYYGASSIGRSAEIHKEMSAYFFNTLYNNGQFESLSTEQFFDPKLEVFLNGRQVTGVCPVVDCASEQGYADECSLGHQYFPKDLIDPRSTLTGEKPEMREVKNWYFKLPEYKEAIEQWVELQSHIPGSRDYVIKYIREFLSPPVVHIKKKFVESLESIRSTLPAHTLTEKKNESVYLTFNTLEAREKACLLLSHQDIQFRTGKTLVPFRLTGNIEWGVPVPACEGVQDLTFWVWPESLWAPISFTSAYLEQKGLPKEAWKEWWTSQNNKIYQFIGEDNIYFYGIAEMGMFMGMQGTPCSPVPPQGELQLPELIVNNHILFLNIKASSSGKIKPPMAMELLDYYTSDQLRTHFISLGLSLRSVSFQPKPLDPDAGEKAGDPVMKEGNLLCKVFNRAIRSCFYTLQEFYNGILPDKEISPEIIEEAREVVIQFERFMFEHKFHVAMAKIDKYIRGVNKYWSKNMQILQETNDDELRKQTLVDTFYMVKIAGVLMHPIAPTGTELLREYLNIGEEFWSWDHIFDPITSFIKDSSTHRFKFLEPREDFFEKHPYQIEQFTE